MRPLPNALGDPLRERLGDIAEGTAFATVDVLRDATGESDQVRRHIHRQWRREQQRLGQTADRLSPDHADHDVGERIGKAIQIGGVDRLAETELDAERPCHLQGRVLDAGEHAVIAHGDQAAPDRDGAGTPDLAVLDQRELGRAPADVHVEHGSMGLPRHRGRAASMRRQRAFHVVPCRGAHELSRVCGKESGDGLRVAAFRGFAREDDGAAVDVFRREARGAVGVVDEHPQPLGIDGVIGDKRGEQDRRAPEDFATHDHELARQQLRLALQMHPGEHQVRGRAADVDTHRGELDVLGLPDHLGESALGVVRPVVEVRRVVVVQAHGRGCRHDRATTGGIRPRGFDSGLHEVSSRPGRRDGLMYRPRVAQSTLPAANVLALRGDAEGTRPHRIRDGLSVHRYGTANGWSMALHDEAAAEPPTFVGP